MEIILAPTFKQHQAYQKLNDIETKYVVFGGGAGGGKSWLGCEFLLVNCIRYPGTKWFLGREELKRIMASTYITFTKVLKHHKIPDIFWTLNGQYNYIQFSNGSRIDLLDLKYLPSDPLYERFGSLEYTGGWIEEAGETEFLAFDTLKSRVGRHLNKEYNIPSKILITCNPKKNWLYRDIYKPFKEETLPKEYAFIQSLYGDNPHTSDQYQSDLSQIKDKATKQRLMNGIWEYDSDDNALIEYDAITDLFTNSVEPSSDKYATIDVARYGQDRTVMMFWQGLKVYNIIVWTKQGLDVIETNVRTLLNDHQIPFSHTIIDEDGVGGGLVDNLKGVKGFIANSTPLENIQAPIIEVTNKIKVKRERENYQNLKTQCSYILAEKINSHQVAVFTQDQKIKSDLTEELEQIKQRDSEKEGKLKIIPKEEVKEMIGRSPDLADCMVMRMYFELKQASNYQPTFYKSNKSYR